MCGIVGAIAQRDVAAILLEGLKRLEYRGYDSAGLAVIDATSHDIHRHRVIGKVAGLEKAQQEHPLLGHLGIAHTRWATHGEPNKANAHPHTSANEIAVVHNGIIENHDALRKQLTAAGYEFSSATDTEVIVHLIHHHLQKTGDLVTAIRAATNELRGAFALGIIAKHDPETLYAVRFGSPLVIGLGIGEHFIASDPLALLPVTQRFIYLEDGDLSVLRKDDIIIYDAEDQPIERTVHHSKLASDNTSKGNYRHFMLKEIYEQPDSLTNTIDGHFINEKLTEKAFGHRATDILKDIKRVKIVACGTSYHAGLIACHWIERLSHLPCSIEIASENRYRHQVVEPDTLFVALSQSGETADTLAAMRSAKTSGYAATLAICNVPESSLVREADLVFLTRAGAEIGVAATKTFTSQLVALLLLSLALAKSQNRLNEETAAIAQDILKLPNLVNEVLKLDEEIQKISKRISDRNHALYLGRGDHHPVAMEGALKLKEISYMHAEAYPAGELKHGPLALVDDEMPVIIVAPDNALFEKLKSNIQEVQARGGDIYIFAHEDLEWDSQSQKTIIPMPEVPEVLSPILYTIPLQLLSYHVAILRGTDVDQPRNLAKSVTVE